MLAVELGDRGYETVATKNGREAFDLIERGERFDLVLSDVEMPLMDGLALTCALRERPETEKLPVVIYSSIGDIGMKNRAEFLNANAHVTKLNVEELLETVGQLIS
jgi:CheY-like chemotaxis protein